MELQPSTTLFLIISTTVLLTSTTTGHPFPPFSDDTNYIRTSCERTLYPETCFTTLYNYSGTIHHDLCRLASVAINVALCNVTNMADYVTYISNYHANSTNTAETAAIRDCSSVFEDAVDQIKRSRKEMMHLCFTGESGWFHFSNVLTWMSAALTDEDTCMDGFVNVQDGGDLKTDVLDRVAAVMEVTSNALALVNYYAHNITA